jgi:Ca-activated chloride channel family protein
MSPDSRKTAAILCAAGGLVTAALLLEPSLAGGLAAPAADPGAASGPAGCGAAEGAAQRLAARLDHTRVSGALSAGSIARGGGGQVFAAFDLSADPLPASVPRQPLNLALVVDRSGSMADEDKLVHAQEAALALIDRLAPADHIALVQYDTLAQVLVPSTAADRAGKERLRAAVRALQPGGSTNLYGGLTLGRDEVQRGIADDPVSRVLLLSDGIVTAGESDPATIADAARAAADRGVRITAVGVGVHYNEDLMEAIAESGRGRYYYVRDAAALEGVLAGELGAAQSTIAGQAELRLRPACPGVEITRVFGYDTRRDGDAVVVPLADLAGGDHRRLVVELRAPDRAIGRRGAVTAELTYRDVLTGRPERARLSLALDVTGDADAAQRSIDASVMAQVLEVQAADALRRAARAYQEGDAAGAAALLRESRDQLAEQGGRAGVAPAAIAPALGDLDSFAAQASSTAFDSVAGKELVKDRKAAARSLSRKEP